MADDVTEFWKVENTRGFKRLISNEYDGAVPKLGPKDFPKIMKPNPKIFRKFSKKLLLECIKIF